MEMETDADRLESIRALGGVRVSSPSGEFWAIFDAEYRAAVLGGLEIESRGPALTCRTSDVASRPKDEMLTVEAPTLAPDQRAFRIKKAEPDMEAPGWTVLLLKR